jgi:hypothetical protein
MPDGIGKAASDALKISEHPITPLVPQLVQGRRKKTLVIHVSFFPPRGAATF